MVCKRCGYQPIVVIELTRIFANDFGRPQHLDRPSAEQKMQRSADRLAHKAAQTQKNHEADNSEFSNIGPHKSTESRLSLT